MIGRVICTGLFSAITTHDLKLFLTKCVSIYWPEEVCLPSLVCIFEKEIFFVHFTGKHNQISFPMFEWNLLVKVKESLNFVKFFILRRLALVHICLVLMTDSRILARVLMKSSINFPQSQMLCIFCRFPTSLLVSVILLLRVQ